MLGGMSVLHSSSTLDFEKTMSTISIREPSFWTGVTSVLGIFGHGSSPTIRWEQDPYEADWQALMSDWQAVDQDLEHAWHTLAKR